MIRYGEAISQAFKALRSKGLWGFAITAELLIAVPLSLGLSYYMSQIFGAIGSASSGSTQDIRQVLTAVAVLLAAVLITLPITLLRHGGMVHLSGRAVVGDRVTTGQGWSLGARMMGRTLGVEFLIGLVMNLVVAIGVVPLFAAAFFAGASGESAGSSGAVIGAIFALCCGVALFFALILAAVLLVAAWEALSIRYAIIGGRTFGDAVKSGFSAFRARFKNVFVFALIVIGMQYAYQAVVSSVLYPIQLIAYGPGYLTGGDLDPQRMMAVMPLIFGLSFVLVLPMQVFYYALWSAAFRQLVGCDTPAAAPVPAPGTSGAYPDSPPLPPEGFEAGPPMPPAEVPVVEVEPGEEPQ